MSQWRHLKREGTRTFSSLRRRVLLEGRSPGAYSLVPSFARIVQAVLLDVLLHVGGATRCTALRTAVRGLVRVDALVGSEAALVGQQHGAHVTHLSQEWERKETQTSDETRSK